MSDDHRRRLFQLVVTTTGRPELERLLTSIENQSARDIHLVVVDQSEGDHVAALCRRHAERLAITQVRSAGGASKGRNAGIREIGAHEGGSRIVAFPDDDCWYPDTLLLDVQELLDSRPEWDGCTGRSVTAEGAESTGRWDREAGLITRGNVWRRGVAFTIFLREPVVAQVGLFDETLGPGAGTRYGAGEETDYLLRALHERRALLYKPELVVHHPDKLDHLDAAAFAKSRSYGAGMGRVLRKHEYGVAFVGYTCLRPLGGAMHWLTRGRPARARYHWESFLGRMRGAFRPDAQGD